MPSLIITPDSSIPLPENTTPEDLKDFEAKAIAYFKTVELVTQGSGIEVTQEDKAHSHQIFTSGKMPEPAELTNGAIINLTAILNEYDHEILGVSHKLRNYVTNKLLLESTDTDARIRLKALELLGKLSGVGLFSDRLEVNVTHRSIKDIEEELRKTLNIYTGKTVDAENIKTIEVSPVELDINKLLDNQ